MACKSAGRYNNVNTEFILKVVTAALDGSTYVRAAHRDKCCDNFVKGDGRVWDWTHPGQLCEWAYLYP